MRFFHFTLIAFVMITFLLFPKSATAYTVKVKKNGLYKDIVPETVYNYAKSEFTRQLNIAIKYNKKKKKQIHILMQKKCLKNMLIL